MLGSHNSLSYLPIKGWRKILQPWVRCQSKSLEAQYKLGIRYFDIRVRLINNDWHYCHNNANLGSMVEHWEVLKFLGSHEDIKVRVILDVRSVPSDPITYKIRFRDLVWNVMANLNNICIDSVIVFWEWKEYTKPKLQQYEYHNSVVSPWYKYILGNKRFSKLNNKKIRLEHDTQIKSDEQVVLIDYVQY